MKVLLRVDIDFSFGMSKGVPWLLSLLAAYGIKATFLCVMGPDTVMSHAKRVGKLGYLSRILSMNPVKMLYYFGPTFPLRGTLLPPKMVGAEHPEVLRAIARGGHELGLHGYNHAQWADKWLSMGDEDVRKDVEMANMLFEKIMGRPSKLWGAPNWRVAEPLYRYLDGHHSQYTSNVRGIQPFFPRFGEKTYQTMELPITLPALHEIVQAGIPKAAAGDVICNNLKPDYNMWVIHCYYEGLLERGLFESTLLALLKKGAEFCTFKEYYNTIALNRVESDDIGTVRVPGGFGEVSCQKRFLRDNYFDAITIKK